MDRLRITAENFMRCGAAGWCMEVVFTATESLMRRNFTLMGQTSLLMFPIYGCAVLLRPIALAADAWIGGQKPGIWEQRLRHGFLYMVLIFMMEYLSGAFLTAYGICPWSYAGRPFSVNGLIRLDFAPLWFCAGLLFEHITVTHDPLLQRTVRQ